MKIAPQKIVEKIINALWYDSGENIESYFDAKTKVESPVLNYLAVEPSPKKTLEAIINHWREAFSDFELEKSIKVSLDGQTIMVMWSAAARHDGKPFVGIKAVNKPVVYSGETIYEFEKGMLKKYSSDFNLDYIKDQIK